MSSALKRLIGRDLITNPYVAVFELVKNSHDAYARKVTLVFGRTDITIVDDGSGMSAADIRDKWLFVAYSGKKDASLDPERPAARLMAGNKGVGRFAADQLGSRLLIQTRVSGAVRIQVVDVSWDEFEHSQRTEFAQIPVHRRTATAFQVPRGTRPPRHGTIITISGLREEWDRDKLLKLREYLTRLIDPFADRRDKFEIDVVVPDERARDEEADPNRRVNGPIRSGLLDALEIGTTSIRVQLSDDGQTFETTLVDRGMLVYKLREPNKYAHLRAARFEGRLYYLNQAAKARFTRTMGFQPVQFGSVFLFRNGFRVFPIGEIGNDFFGLDRRKQQGYARYLGTREVIGRVNVLGTHDEFQESTSRDQGLIETPAVAQMKECFQTLVLRRLEAYVTGVTWADIFDKEEMGTSRLQTADARGRIVMVLAGLARQAGVKILATAPDLDSLLSEQLALQDPAVRALETIARNQGDTRLLDAVRRTKRRVRALIAERGRAEAHAEAARMAKDAADARAEQLSAEKAATQEELDRVAAAYQAEQARSLFFAAATPLDVETLQGFLHQIGLQATDVAALAENAMALLQRRPVDSDALARALERILWRAQQSLAVTKFATKANFRLDTAQVTLDLAQFFEEYARHVASVWSDIRVVVRRQGGAFERRSRPIDVSIIVDNLISNARRAGATSIAFDVSADCTGRKPQLTVQVSDNGRGLAPSVLDAERIFERGYTTTHGSGLGLWHVRHAMQESGGTIAATIDEDRRLTFLLTFPK